MIVASSHRVANSDVLPHEWRYWLAHEWLPRHCGYTAIGVPIVKGCHICNHGCPWLGRGNAVGLRIRGHMWPKSPAAGHHGEIWSVGPKEVTEGCGEVDGMGWGSGHWRSTPGPAQEDGLVQSPSAATHGICMGGSALMVFTREAHVVLVWLLSMLPPCI